MNPPLLSHEQREFAREVALQARRQRSAIKEAVRTGRTSPIDVLTSTDPAQRAMRVSDLLRAMPKVGPVKCSQIMERIGISPSRRISGLSPRQRHELMCVLDPQHVDAGALADG